MTKKILFLFSFFLLSACENNSTQSDYSSMSHNNSTISNSLSNSINNSNSQISSSSSTSSIITSNTTSSSSSINYPWISSATTFSDENESILKLVIDSQKVYATDLTNTFDDFKNIETDYILQDDQLTFSCEFYDLVFGENIALNFSFTIQKNEDIFTFILNEDVTDSYDFCVYESGLILKQI